MAGFLSAAFCGPWGPSYKAGNLGDKWYLLRAENVSGASACTRGSWISRSTWDSWLHRRDHLWLDGMSILKSLVPIFNPCCHLRWTPITPPCTHFYVLNHKHYFSVTLSTMPCICALLEVSCPLTMSMYPLYKKLPLQTTNKVFHNSQRLYFSASLKWNKWVFTYPFPSIHLNFSTIEVTMQHNTIFFRIELGL